MGVGLGLVVGIDKSGGAGHNSLSPGAGVVVRELERQLCG
jgi:hypothetical protein